MADEGSYNEGGVEGRNRGDRDQRDERNDRNDRDNRDQREGRQDREPRGDQRDAKADAQAADESDITTNWDEITPTFDAMDLKEELLRGTKLTNFQTF